jgi:hypothetical protein
VRATWLADAFRTAGLDVYEMPGWLTRESRAGFDPRGVICHHTATSAAWSDAAVAALLRDGRRDLAGPLSQMGLERDGTVVLVAAGRANHNGFGTWGNDSYGIEAYNDGKGEPWPPAQLAAYRLMVKVICEHHGWGPSQVLGHLESDPVRKIDPVGIDMDSFRRAVFVKAPQPQPKLEFDDMLIVTCKGKATRLLTGLTGSVIDGVTVSNLKAAGIKSVEFEAEDYDRLVAHIAKSFG